MRLRLLKDFIGHPVSDNVRAYSLRSHNRDADGKVIFHVPRGLRHSVYVSPLQRSK